MKKNGFTLTELLATLVILGIITGIVLITVTGDLSKAKEETENVFIDTIVDAISIYLSDEAKKLDYDEVICSIDKTHQRGVKIYKSSTNITINDLINSKYHPISKSDLINPANEKVECNLNAEISLYRDDDFVYYYKLAKEDLACLLITEEYITNLPYNLPKECLTK